MGNEPNKLAQAEELKDEELEGVTGGGRAKPIVTPVAEMAT